MLLRRNLSPKPFSLLRSITAVPFSTSAVDFLPSYTVTPPIQDWPHPKRLISLITREPKLDLALQIFHHASKYHPGFHHNYHTYHAIIRHLLRSRAFHLIDPLLSDLRASNLRCSEDLFISLIRNYGVVSRPKLAFKTFITIPKFGVQRSVRSLNALLNALVQNHEYRLVHSVFRNCRERFDVAPNVFSFNILIKALCKREMIWMRWRKQGKLVEAIKVMDEMEDNGIGANEVTYGVMIEAYCKEKKSGEVVNSLNHFFICKAKLSSKLVKRADVWVKELGLSNIHFMYANATTSFNQLVSTYPGPLMLVSILCPDPYFKRKHHKRRVVQKPLVDSIVNNLAPRGQVFIQSDVLDVALEMRNQFDSLPHVLKHVDEIESSVLCDSEGWLLSNPMGKRTEREIHAEFEGAKIYRRVYQKQAQKTLG